MPYAIIDEIVHDLENRAGKKFGDVRADLEKVENEYHIYMVFFDLAPRFRLMVNVSFAMGNVQYLMQRFDGLDDDGNDVWVDSTKNYNFILGSVDPVEQAISIIKKSDIPHTIHYQHWDWS